MIKSKYADIRVKGTNYWTATKNPKCKHLNGWYVTVPFWVFKKRIFVCSDCGHQEPK